MSISRAASEQSIKLSSTTTTESSNDAEQLSSIETRVCLIGDALNNEDLKNCLKDLNISFVSSQDGHEYLDDDDPFYETVFIIDDFESSIFNQLKQTQIRILGPPVIFSVSQTNMPLPYNARPLYCTCMQGLNLCFTNFKTKEHLGHLVTLCHYMGACIRKEMTTKIDFLVTNSLHGPKYRTAVSLGTPVMKEEWVHRCWAARQRRTMFKATDDEFLTPCKSKPFEGCKLSFLGFSAEEKQHMEEQAEQQGGVTAEVGDPSCTHLVVDEYSVKSLPFIPQGRLYIVVQEWFWGSIQIEAKAAESLYIFDLVEYPQRLTKISSTSSLLGTPRWKGVSSSASTRSSTGTRKRVRLREETLAKLALESEPDSTRPPCKRPSTDTSACIPDSMLDYSNNATTVKSELFTQPGAPFHSARYQVALEFLQTEKNYVGILQTILNLFKKPLDDPNQPGGQMIASEDIKAIFGSLPEMESVHRSMRDRLDEVLKSWSVESCVGNLVLSYVDEFGRCYPSFVNFFEASLETINRCDAKSPRFHAFLKINQAKKECGRQTLAELLINPVQRIPRIILLLQDIKKHTERENPEHSDVKGIESCLEALKGVMAHINEDKRKTESQRQIFDIVYEVDACPPTLVSSHRQFVSRAEVIAVDNNLCSRGDHISIFVFSDCVEIAKRRRGSKPISRSPTVHTRSQSNAKSLKHIKLMSLLHIKKVVDIKNSEDCEDAFALYCRTPTDSQDWLYTFKIIFCTDDSTKPLSEDNVSANKENSLGGENSKRQLLAVLARHRTNALCKTNDDNFICSIDAHELDVSTTDLGSTFGRAVRAAKKSSRKLTRAFSFNRTPRRAVQRAVSNLLSPAVNNRSQELTNGESGNLGQTSTLTPSISVASLCTPQRERRKNRMPSTSSLQSVEEMDVCSQTPKSVLKSAVSTVNLSRPQTAADLSDFPAIPTPPTRRRKVGASIKAATISFGRTGSFRRRKKQESVV